MILRSILLAFGLLTAVAPAARAEVLVFAAASLKEPLDRMAAAFDGVVVSYGGSGTIARQISFGAPADVVLLANVDWMDVLVDEGHVQAASLLDFASNRLVIIGQAGAAPIDLAPASIMAALGEGRIAVGFTKAVPAGIYAKAALQALGLWDGVEGHLAEVDSVRSALVLVARGQAPLGIVYQTDARVSDAVVPLARFPINSHPPIRYVGALTPNAPPQATAFLAYVSSTEGKAVLAEAGFLPPLDDKK